MILQDQKNLEKIFAFSQEIEQYFIRHEIEKEQILVDRDVQLSIGMLLINIGEQVCRLSTELKQAYPKIAWKAIAGLRHRLAHDYDATDWNILLCILKEKLPEITEQIEEILESKKRG